MSLKLFSAKCCLWICLVAILVHEIVIGQVEIIARLLDQALLKFLIKPVLLDEIIHDTHVLAVPAQKPSLLGIRGAVEGAIPPGLPEVAFVTNRLPMLTIAALAELGCGLLAGHGRRHGGSDNALRVEPQMLQIRHRSRAVASKNAKCHCQAVARFMQCCAGSQARPPLVQPVLQCCAGPQARPPPVQRLQFRKIGSLQRLTRAAMQGAS